MSDFLSVDSAALLDMSSHPSFWKNCTTLVFHNTPYLLWACDSFMDGYRSGFRDSGHRSLSFSMLGSSVSFMCLWEDRFLPFFLHSQLHLLFRGGSHLLSPFIIIIFLGMIMNLFGVSNQSHCQSWSKGKSTGGRKNTIDGTAFGYTMMDVSHDILTRVTDIGISRWLMLYDWLSHWCNQPESCIQYQSLGEENEIFSVRRAVGDIFPCWFILFLESFWLCPESTETVRGTLLINPQSWISQAGKNQDGHDDDNHDLCELVPSISIAGVPLDSSLPHIPHTHLPWFTLLQRPWWAFGLWSWSSAIFLSSACWGEEIGVGNFGWWSCGCNP